MCRIVPGAPLKSVASGPNLTARLTMSDDSQQTRNPIWDIQRCSRVRSRYGIVDQERALLCQPARPTLYRSAAGENNRSFSFSAIGLERNVKNLDLTV